MLVNLDYIVYTFKLAEEFKIGDLIYAYFSTGMDYNKVAQEIVNNPKTPFFRIIRIDKVNNTDKYLSIDVVPEFDSAVLVYNIYSAITYSTITIHKKDVFYTKQLVNYQYEY